MEPVGKRPPKTKPPAPPEGRRIRFDPAHDRTAKPPHYISGGGRPGDR